MYIGSCAEEVYDQRSVYIYVHTHLSCTESQLHICYNNLGYVWGDCRVNGRIIEPHAHNGYMCTDAIR